MADPFVGEIRMFAGNFAPRGWALCDGQLLSVSQNDALFSLLGTVYGGDGRTTFGLPDLRGRIPVHAGQGPGLSQRRLGEKGGQEQVTLNVNEWPSHTHAFRASKAIGAKANPTGQVVAAGPSVKLFTQSPPNAYLASTALTSVGGGQPHSNVMPFLGINFIIALVGVYPSRT